MVVRDHPSFEPEPAMPAAVDRALVALLRAEGGERGDAGADASDRRAVPEVSVLRRPPDGSRHLRREGVRIGRRRAARLIAPAGSSGGLSGAARTSDPHPEHRVWPYLLKGLRIERGEPRLVRRHHLHPGAPRLPLPGGDHGLGKPATSWPGGCRTRWMRASVSRRSRRPWTAMARQRSSTPTRAASSPASPSPGALQAAGIRISMDGRGRCMDNIFIERLWRSLKYEAVYLHEIADGLTARRVIADWIGFYNTREASLGARRADSGRGLPGRPACGYDGQAATRLAHRSTGATAATGRSIQGDSGGLRNNRNTP